MRRRCGPPVRSFLVSRRPFVSCPPPPFSPAFTDTLPALLPRDDIRAIFGPTAAPGYSAAQNTLTSDVQQRWASFVRSGNPNNVDDLISWPPVATSTGDLNVLVLGADAATGKSAIKKTQRDEICKLGTGLYSPR